MHMIHSSLQSFDASHHTLKVLYKKLVWSFDLLFSGLKPIVDWLGESIPGAEAEVEEDPFLMGGKFMAVWAFTHDMEHGYKAMELPNPTAKKPCGICGCDSGPNKWWDFRPNSNWMGKVFNHAEFQGSGFMKCVLFQIVGVTVLCLYPDWMHCKSLGTDKPLIGFRTVFTNMGA